ncbi:MAG: hypothetical protein RLZZ156_492 [Deinococcota bacterium]
MKRVFLCIPKEDEHLYLDLVQSYVLEAMQQHYAPFAPYAQVLVDAEEKGMALQCALAYLQVCDEVWVYGEPSLSMQTEISMALELGIPLKSQPMHSIVMN